MSEIRRQCAGVAEYFTNQNPAMELAMRKVRPPKLVLKVLVDTLNSVAMILILFVILLATVMEMMVRLIHAVTYALPTPAPSLAPN